MAVIKVKWLVDELENVMSQFDVQKVYWSATEGGTYAEATDVSTRVPLVVDQVLYYFDHLTGDPTYWYKVSYYNTTTTQESSTSDPFQASEAGGYTTLADVRAAGITVTQADDATVIAAIKQWSQFIDRACRQWFEPRYIDTKLDGNDTRVLWISVPIIGVDALYMNGDWDNAVETEAYEIYNNLGRGLRDDRRDPKITVADEYTSTDLYRRLAYGARFRFAEGRKNQQVKGTFGFVEYDGSTPELIKRATLKLVVKQLGSPSPLIPPPAPAGPVISETTDGHTIRYASMVGGRKIGISGITGDPEVDGIILLYKSPKAIEVSSNA